MLLENKSSRHRVISSISPFYNVVCIFFHFDPRSLEVYYRWYHCWSVSIFSRFQSVFNEKKNNNNNNNNKCPGSKAILQIHLSILIISLKYFSVFLLNCKIRHASEGTNSKITMFAHFREYHGSREKIKSLYGFGGRCHKIADGLYGIFNHVSRIITWFPFNFRAPNLVKNQSQHDFLYGGVSLSISLNLKLAPVPYATPKWPISCVRECTSSVIISWQILA